MKGDFHLALAPGATAEVVGDRFVLFASGRRLQVKDLTRGLAGALATLARTGGLQQDLAHAVRQVDGVGGLARFYYTIEHLLKQGFVVESVRRGDRTLATLVVLSPYFEPAECGRGERFLLSRFAFLRRIDDQLALEQPLGHARILLVDAVAVSLLHSLARPCTLADLQDHVAALDESACSSMLALLGRAAFVAPVNDGGHAACDDDAPLRSWEFHDLLFHSRSRIGRHDAAVGASFRLAGAGPCPPAFRTPHEGASIDLPVPDLARALESDPPFAAVQEGRRSFRHYGHPAICAQQLGDFLYRVASVRETLPGTFDAPGGPIPGEFSVRPYPSGGSLYELEIYPVIANSADLPRGLCHYDARSHKLVRLAADERQVAALVASAASRAGIAPGSAQIVFNITARFDRVAWKYESMAYALVLKHVGVLFETMYLVATALDLAPCAIGSGDSDLFAAATRIDYFAEGLVGEFLLGTRP